MDTLYIGNIPSDYHYAQFGNDYITLYNQPQGYNNTLNYYRIYFNYDRFMYAQGQQQFTSYNPTTFQNVDVSNSWWYRKDLSDILLSVFIIAIFFVFIFNIMTSCVKKGGLFGGLL